MSTPLRKLYAHEQGEGVTVLPSAVAPPVDARLKRLRRLLADASGLPSWDPRLVARAQTPLDALEVEPGAANFLRSLDLNPRSTVLILGAATGLTTRYLAETVPLVDALEPNAHLAQLAGERVSDLAAARVFAGTISDVPVAATYDVIVASDALREGPDAAHSFIATALRLLLPGGTLVLAETNRLGVKYLVGAPDDDTGAVFDGVEGYPGSARHPALSRRELDQLLDAGGLKARVVLALPHHREVRALVDTQRLTPETAALPADLAITPSPDLIGSRPRLADETAVWRQAVEAGLTDQLANSFVVLATVDGESDLWPADRVASYHSWRRAPQFTSQTAIEAVTGSLMVHRTYSHADPVAKPLVADSVTPFVPGRSVLEALVDADDSARAELLRQWSGVVHGSAQGALVSLDAHPGNVIIGADGSLTPIDLEYITAADADVVVRRGLLVAGRALALLSTPQSWPTSFGVLRDVIEHLGQLIDVRADGWLDRTLDEEAVLQRTIAGDRGAGRTRGQWRAQLAEMVQTPLTRLPLGARTFDELAAARDRIGELDARIRQLEAHEAALVDHNALLVHGVADRDARLEHFAGQLAAAARREADLRAELEERAREFEEFTSAPSIRAILALRQAASAVRPGGKGAE